MRILLVESRLPERKQLKDPRGTGTRRDGRGNRGVRIVGCRRGCGGGRQMTFSMIIRRNQSLPQVRPRSKM